MRTAMMKHQMLRTGFANVKDRDHSFVMVQYNAAAFILPWEDVSDTNSMPTEEWLPRAERNACENLHQPPWQIRTINHGSESFLELAIFHALYDAQSLRAILDDVSKAYDQSPLDAAPALEPAIGTILGLSSTQKDESREFWQRLGSSMSPSRFPNLAPLRYDPAPPLVVSKICTTPLSKLEVGCRTYGITLQAVGIASWLFLLSGYTGEASATCGVVLSGRNFDAAESAVFPCITTIPLCCTADDDKAKMLKTVMALNAETQQHQFTPLNEIQRLMGYPNEPLFDSIFTFQKIRNGDTQPDHWTIVDEKATVEYPVSIELEPKDDSLELRLTFLPHIVPKEQASLILDQLDHLINDFVFSGSERSTPETVDAKLYSTTPPKEPTLRSEIRLLHEFIEASALRTPDRIALEFATSIEDDKYMIQAWTYAQVNSEGNKVANLLLSRGAQPGSLVGVCFDKCPEAYFAILGILKAGCAFVALDPSAPIARRAFIVEDSSAGLVLSMKAQSSGLAESVAATVLNMDELDLNSVDATRPILQRPITPQDLSYCLYTSGTTGTPKGCELTHENAVQAMLSFRRLFSGHWDEQSRWLQFASFHFDVSVLEQYWSWFVGIRLVSAPRDLIFEDLARTIRVLEITHIDLTPSLARILHPDDVPSLCRGVFITGGESLKQEILDVWGPKGVIYNGYGPTEATIGVTMYPRVPVNGKPSNIGPAFDNVGSFVLRPGTDIPVLRGGVGELCVSGKLVGKGYLNRQQLTEERFPYLARFGERVYRTGDLVRILHDGTFDFLGRADDQVKLRGQRLEIGEINSIIKQSSAGISDVATLVLKHSKQQKEQLVSFLVTGSKSNDKPQVLVETMDDVETAREACRDRLPGYMVPTHFIPLSAMPLSANNKAETKKLKEMYNALSVFDLQSLSGPANGKKEEWSTDEKKIRAILHDMLQIEIEDIKRRSSIFELGLDSVSVIGFSRTLKQAGFEKAAASLIMKNPSLDRLSKALSDRNSTSDDRGSIITAQQAIIAIQHRHRLAVAESLSINSEDIETLAPCTPLQQGMIARFLDSDNGLYFSSFYLALSKDVDEDKLRDAWKMAFESIQILRTAFTNTEDGYCQAVHRRPSFPWSYCGLSAEGSLSDRLKDLKRRWWLLNRTVLKKPFELHLVTTPKRKILAVHMFHALYDGISAGLLFQTVWNIYNSNSKPDIGPPFQSVLAHGPLRSVKGAQDFWRAHLSNQTVRTLPGSSVESASRGAITLTREVRYLSGYQSVRRRLNVNPQAVAQACWATVLHNFLRGTVTLGMVVSGRSIDLDDAERIIGPMFNTLPYQHKLQPSESYSSIIKRTHDFNVAALPYQHTPLRDIMKWTKRGPSQPLFDTLFVYQAADQDQEWTKNKAWGLEDGEEESDYPLAIEIEQAVDETLKVSLVAQRHALDQSTAEQLLDDFERTLRAALENPDDIVKSVFADGVEAEPNGSPSNSPLPTDGANDFEWTPPARKIRDEIASLAGVDETDMNERTSIFELGLDSIDAIKLSSKLKKHGIDLAVSGIMRSLTIANMVAKISEGNTQPKKPSDMIFRSDKRKLEDFIRRSGALPKDIERVLPLTPLQEAMVAEMLSSRYARYYNHDVLKLAPDVDLERLQSAWATVVKDSPILRTSFIEVDDPAIDYSFAQVVRQTPHDFLHYEKIHGEPNFRKILGAIQEDAANAAQPGPLFHIHIFDCPSQTYLVLSIAHALYDGWSLGLLHSDLEKAYKGLFKPRPDYEPALREILTASGSDAALFWQDFLGGAKPTSFRRRQIADVERTHRLERQSNMNLANLTSFTKKHNITLQALGQTVYSLVLSSYAHSLDVSFGSVLSGRDDENMSEILFPTMNTVAIRSILHGSRREMLQYMQENLLSIKQWQHLPLRKSQALAGAQGALFESLFIYQRAATVEDDDMMKLYESIEGQIEVEYPVCVEMEVLDGGFIWRCAIKEEVFDHSGANEFLDRLDTVLRAVVEQPDAPTIDFTTAGASICGLPAFQDEHFAEATPLTEPGVAISVISNSATVKAIREVLALVSKTPEDEIKEEMTIFHIGLDSISAIKVSSLLRKRDISLSVGEMLRAGTIENMAQIVDGRKQTNEEEVGGTEAILKEAMRHLDQEAVLREAGMETIPSDAMRPATAGQLYMLAMWRKSNYTLFYPEFSYQLKGDVSFDGLQKSWQALLAANPILRTDFVATKDSTCPYLQVVIASSDGPIVDISDLDETAALTLIEKGAREQPYVHLFVSKSSTGWDLRLKIHHALYDGVSLPLLMQQYQDACNGIELPASRDTFDKFIAQGLSSSGVQLRKTFWTNYLADISPNLPTETQSPSRSKTEVFKPALLQDIKPFDDLARKHGISTQSLFIAAYAKLYAALTSTPADRDIVIGIYLADRSHPIPHLSESAVPTVNLVSLRVSMPLQNDILAIATKMQHDMQQISSPENAAVSLYEIKEWTDVVVDTFVNFLKLPELGMDSEEKQKSGLVTISQTGTWEGEVSIVVEMELPRWVLEGEERGVVDSRVTDAYLHAIDIEATIRNGALDVGIFAPNEMLRLEDAEMLVWNLKKEMEGVLRGVV